MDLTALAVCRHRDVHLLWPGQVETRHDRDELVEALAASEAWVALKLLVDAADMPLLIIVTGIDERVAGKAENLLMDRPVQGRRVAVLKIGSAAAIDQERIARKHPAGIASFKKVAVVIVGVPRSI